MAPDLAQVRAYHLDRLDQALRRAGMWGGETTLRLFMDTMAFVDGRDEEWLREQETLRARGASTGAGVRGAFAGVLPGYRDDGAVASVYAEVAWRLGWLDMDRVLPAAEHRALRDEAVSWCARDLDFDGAMALAGTPSKMFGGNNPRYPRTVAYAADDRAAGLVCLHFGSTHEWTVRATQPAPRVVLLGVRHGAGVFAETFTFTPAGALIVSGHRERDGGFLGLADGAPERGAG